MWRDSPKISTLLAVVKRPRQIEKIAEYATMTPSRSTIDWTKYKVNMEAAGMHDASRTPMLLRSKVSSKSRSFSDIKNFNLQVRNASQMRLSVMVEARFLIKGLLNISQHRLMK